MRYTILFFLVVLPAVTIVVSCKNTDKQKEVNPDSIYFDYRVTGDEDAGYITVRLQYKPVNAGGTGLVLPPAAKVELDGTIIRADSSKMNGAYYELTKPVKEFAGHHVINYTDAKGKQYSEEFNFEPITMKTNLAAIVNREDLPVDLEGVDSLDYIKVMLTDTSRFGEGVDRTDTVRNGHIIISKASLAKLANGHIVFELTKEREKRVKEGTRAGGKLLISYEIRREFELKD